MLDDINRLLLQGRREVQQKQYDRAITTFSAALKLNADSRTAAEINGERGGAYVEKGNLDKAMEDADAAVRLAPEYFRGYQVRGRIYRLRKEFDKAIHELDTALKIAPNFAQLYNNRGNVFSEKGDHQRALQDFNEAIRRASGTIDGYVNRGNEFVALRQFDKALADFNAALRIDPLDSDSYFDRGLAFKGKGDYQAAIADYAKANQLSPHDPVILNHIAWVKATCPADSVRDGKGALAASLEACQLTGFDDPSYLDTLAAAYAEAGDFDTAIEKMTQALRLKLDSENRPDFERRLALYRAHKPYRDQIDATK